MTAYGFTTGAELTEVERQVAKAICSLGTGPQDLTLIQDATGLTESEVGTTCLTLMSKGFKIASNGE